MTLAEYMKTRKDVEAFHAKVQEVVERTVTLRKIKEVTAVDWLSGKHAVVFFENFNGTRDMTIVPVYELEFKED